MEGVYELNIPLLWQALVELGCVASVRPAAAEARRGRASDAFELNELQNRTTAECAYLAEPGRFHRNFLYHRFVA